MITWLRNADADEAEFYALVAAEAAHSPLAGTITPDIVRVAVQDGQVSAFGGVTLCGEADPDGELAFLIVHERWRGQGIGRVLLKDLYRSARLAGAVCVRITAHPSTSGFFDRAGAVRTGTASPSATTPWFSPQYVIPGRHPSHDDVHALAASRV